MRVWGRRWSGGLGGRCRRKSQVTELPEEFAGGLKKKKFLGVKSENGAVPLNFRHFGGDFDHGNIMGPVYWSQVKR